ncbi:MAG: DUF5668 domain-containing protein [Ferruginibacter sp.]
MRNNYSKNTESGRIVAGLILLGVGAVLLLRAMHFTLFPGWIFSWPMILILVGVYSGFKHNFRNNTWMILMAIGGFFLLNQIIPGLRLEPYFWPLLIIGAGLVFILRPRNDFPYNDSGKTEDIKWQDAGTGDNPSTPPTAAGIDGSNFVRIRSVFSGVNRTVISKNFQGAHISSVFGGVEVNFSQADITGPVVIKTEVIFGGIKLYVPAHWAVQNEIDGVFHGVDDKRRFNVAPELNPSKVLILRGSVVFGGIEIKNA